MNCKQVKRSLRYGYPQMMDLQQCEVEAHAQFCESCGQELALSRLMDTLIGSHEEPFLEESPWDEIRLANRIKSRIHEMSERSNSSWETAIISIKSWLLAFGAAAILLLVLSNQLPANNTSDQAERDQASLSSPLISEEILSSNSLPAGIFGEEPEHGQ
jgi:hypothetical protein